jgi:AcrR family transcriptional regulator
MSTPAARPARPRRPTVVAAAAVDTVPATSAAQQILDATLALFKARGLASVSTREVAAATGLSRSHLYYYFGSWEQLRNAAFEQFAATELVAGQQALAVLPPAQALQAFVYECLPAQADASWVLWLHAGDEALCDQAFANVYLAAIRRWEALLAEVIERGVAAGDWRSHDPPRAARQVFALVNGYAGNLLVRPSRAAANAAFEEVMAAAICLLNPGEATRQRAAASKIAR